MTVHRLARKKRIPCKNSLVEPLVVNDAVLVGHNHDNSSETRKAKQSSDVFPFPLDGGAVCLGNATFTRMGEHVGQSCELLQQIGKLSSRLSYTNESVCSL